MSDSVHEFALKIEQTELEKQKIDIIRAYPIPNTKEDILEFMILAASNIDEMSYSQSDSLRKAWKAKLEQSYQKAELVLKNDAGIEKAKEIYDKVIRKERRALWARKIKHFLSITARNVGIWCAIAIMIIAIMMDQNRENASLMEVIGSILLIASVSTLEKRKALAVEYGIGILSGVTTLWLSKFLKNGSLFNLTGGIVIIIVIVNFFRQLASGVWQGRNEKKEEVE